MIAGEPTAALDAGEEGYRVADAIGDQFISRMCRFWGIGTARLMRGELTAAAAQFRESVTEAQAAHDPFGQLAALSHLAHALAHLGDTTAAREAAANPPSWEPNSAASPRASATPGWLGLHSRRATSRRPPRPARWPAGTGRTRRPPRARGRRRRRCPSGNTGSFGVPCRPGLRRREPPGSRPTLRCRGRVAPQHGKGSVHDVRRRLHAAVRNALGDSEFESAWTEGAALCVVEAIAYAHRGRGERKRPSSGWASLTPAERDVIRLVREGLGNKEIAARLFVSPRTVQTHLTHVYTKLGFTSRIQLAKEAARRE